jgi:hypothetical protein
MLTKRYYIGMHSTNDLEDGYLGSGDRLRYSIRKYGKENHKREILEYCKSRKELSSREKEIVSLNEIAKEDCMNLVIGGSGGIFSEEHHEKMKKGASKYMKELWKNPEYREKTSNILRDNTKQNHKAGKIKYDTFTGKKHSEETKQKMRISSKGKGKGYKNSQYGTCWITNGTENKKIKKEEFPNWESKGFKKGRK